MAWKLGSHEFQWAIDLDAFARYAYAVNKVREHREVYCLRSDDGWVVGVDPDSDPVFPMWPHPDFAAVEALDDWADAYSEVVSLDHWRDEITPMLQRKGFAVGVFPAHNRWVHVWPATLLEHIEGQPKKRYDLPRIKAKPPPV